MQDKLLRFPAVRDTVGLSRTSIWRFEKKGLFPKRRQLGANSVGWMSSEIEQWVVTRKQVAQANGEA